MQISRTSFHKLLALFALLASGVALFHANRPARAARASAPMSRPAFAQLPIHFEPNQGQSASSARFSLRGDGYQMFLTDAETVLGMRNDESQPSGNCNLSSAIRLRFVGANPAAAFSGQDELPGKSNYFYGNDPKLWRADVPHYAKVRRDNVYPGVDVVYYGSERQLEYDFIVAPGANPRQIAWRVGGANSLRLDANGDLLIKTRGGELRQRAPVAYQEIGGARRPVAAHYQISEISHLKSTGKAKGQRPKTKDQKTAISFVLGDYDHSQPLIIDPVLSYSSYLGGSGVEYGNSVAVDGGGNLYVAGETNSPNFPGLTSALAGSTDAFVLKLNPAGNAIIYATFIGGLMGDQANAIALDAAGNAYITGRNSSENFPVTAGAFQSFYRGGDFDGFALKLNAAGNALLYSTYLGGGDNDSAVGIAIDSGGAAYVTGGSRSVDFPTTNSFQFNNSGETDAFLTKLNAAGSNVVYSTYMGGFSTDRGSAVAVDAGGNAYVAGLTKSPDFPAVNAAQGAFAGIFDAFLIKFNPTATQAIFSTYLGGAADDRAFGLALDESGNAYITGQAGGGFPLNNALFNTFGGGPSDAFVAKYSPTGARLFSTYYGGGSDDKATSIAYRNGNLYLTGYTASTNFPTVSPTQAANAGFYDAFIAKLNAGGTTVGYATYLGGGGNDNFNGQNINFSGGIAVDAAGAAYVTGSTVSTNFPTVNPLRPTNGGGTDAFIAKLSETQTTNPIDGNSFFVTQHYQDFLNRTPDAAGLAYWTGQLDACSTNAACLNRRRVEVSAAFFVEQEFQNTGYFGYLARRAALGPQPTFAQYLADRSQLGTGAEADKTAFLNAFVQRPEFLAQYPATQSGADFINALLTNTQAATGVNLFDLSRVLLNDFIVFGSRARVLRLVVDDTRLRAAEYNKAFVLAQYFGYLRRDADLAGYNFWLGVLNANPNNVNGMVCAFITSAEYQTRFSPVVTRSNADCSVFP